MSDLTSRHSGERPFRRHRLEILAAVDIQGVPGASG